MPQLDIITFSSSYVWFLLFFFGFFYIFVSVFLPNIYFIFRVREKSLNDLENFINFAETFNNTLDKADFADTESLGIEFATNKGSLNLNPTKLFQSSALVYNNLIDALRFESKNYAAVQQHSYYLLAYSSLIPSFSALTFFISNYRLLIKD
jgi:hypothetical protein